MLLGQIDALEIHLLDRFSVRRVTDQSAIQKARNELPSLLAHRLGDPITDGDALVGPGGGQLLWTHPVSSQSSFSALAFLGRFKTSVPAMESLRRFVWERTVHPNLASVADEQILEQVAAWIARREVVVGYRMLLRGGGAVGEEAPVRPPPAAAPVTASRTKKTWIEFVVIDMEGNRVSDKAYRVMLPDGSLHEGRLDKTGLLRFNNIDPENCVFSLTDMDREAWEKLD